MPDEIRDQRLATVEGLSNALNDLYNWARVAQKNGKAFNLLERRLAGMMADDAVRGMGFLARADVFQETLF